MAFESYKKNVVQIPPPVRGGSGISEDLIFFYTRTRINLLNPLISPRTGGGGVTLTSIGALLM